MTQIALALGYLTLLSQQAILPDPNEATIQDALTTVASQSSVFLQLNGGITYRGKTTQLTSNLYWNSVRVGSTETIQIDLESYSNGVLVKRIVADGNSMFSYDFLLHQYSATSYGGTPGLARPENYRANLLDVLNGASTGNDAYLTKLLRQIFSVVASGAALVSNYTSWMPGVKTYQLVQGSQVTDPINPSVTYYPSASLDYYAYNASPKRTIVFEIAPSPTVDSTGRNVNGLVNLYFNQLETVTGRNRLIQFVITPYSGFTFSTALFTPYSGSNLRGWKNVVGPRPVTH